MTGEYNRAVDTGSQRPAARVVTMLHGIPTYDMGSGRSQYPTYRLTYNPLFEKLYETLRDESSIEIDPSNS